MAGATGRFSYQQKTQETLEILHGQYAGDRPEGLDEGKLRELVGLAGSIEGESRYRQCLQLLEQGGLIRQDMGLPLRITHAGIRELERLRDVEADRKRRWLIGLVAATGSLLSAIIGAIIGGVVSARLQEPLEFSPDSAPVHVHIVGATPEDGSTRAMVQNGRAHGESTGLGNAKPDSTTCEP